MKLAEAYQYPPWLIVAELGVPQWYALFVADAPPQSHGELVERTNDARARKGLPPLEPKLPPGLTPEMAEANLKRAAAQTGLQAAQAIAPATEGPAHG